jgi:predicted permease
MLRDLRYAVRMLLDAKAWTAVVLLSLALGIGANTALFSAVNGLLLRKIPVRDPDGLVRLRFAGRNDMATNSSDYGASRPDAAGRPVRATFSYPMIQQLRSDNQTMTDIVACAPFGRVNLIVDGQADVAAAFISSGNYYQVLGVPARLGRTILPDDDRPAAPAVAVISFRYWRSRFSGDPGVVGKSVRANGVIVAIVGVLPPEFTGIQRPLEQAADIAFPLALDSLLNAGPTRLSQPTTWWLQVMGRLRPGVTPAQVAGNLGGVFQATARAGYEAYRATLTDATRARLTFQDRNQVPALIVDSGSRGVYDASTTDRRAAAILGTVVALVLLLVCANLANLLLSRALGRQREIAVRLSLGATRARLVRQLLTESLLLASIGGALGTVVGYWGQRLLPGALGRPTPIDWWTLSFVIAVTGATGIAFGLAPAVRATGLDLSTRLKEQSRSVARSRTRLTKALLVFQVAVSLALLVGSGLFLRTLQNLRDVEVGFNPENILLFRVNPQLNRYDDSRTLALYGELHERLASVAGVRGVALSQPALMTGAVNSTSIFVQGRTYSVADRGGQEINRLVVSPGFFQMMELRLAGGREFTRTDGETAPKVALINEAAARKYFPDETPIGRRFGYDPEDSGQMEIVGIVRDAKYSSLREPAPPTMYVPYAQARVVSSMFEVRTSGDPLRALASVREAVRQVDPNLPLMDVSTQAEQIERRFLQEKVFAQAYTLFGALSLVIASVGLFGLMSYNVARRTGEIGVRMALGAQARDVLGLVMRESMLLVAVGVGLGLLAAAGGARFVSSQLFGLAASDVPTQAAAAAVMLMVSAVAAYLPARRASRVDPIVALHDE